jgi:hypothetical protein
MHAMAEADAEHSTEFVPSGWETPGQALARKVAEGRDSDDVRNALQSALMLGQLAAAEPTRGAYFRDLSDYLPDLALGGLTQADQAAVRSLGRGFAIPRETWCQWVEDGSFRFDRDEVPRLFPGRVERFRPLLQIAEVDRFFPSLKPAAAPELLTAEHAAAASTAANTAQWVVAELEKMKANGEIRKSMTPTDAARILVQRAPAAIQAGKLKKSIGYRHITNNWRAWDLNRFFD